MITGVDGPEVIIFADTIPVWKSWNLLFGRIPMDFFSQKPQKISSAES